jgi:hypothetical protein
MTTAFSHWVRLEAPYFSTEWKTLFSQLVETELVQERVFQWKTLFL